MKSIISIFALLTSLQTFASVNYNIDIQLFPEKSEIQATSQLQFPVAKKTIKFYLHSGLQIGAHEGQLKLLKKDMINFYQLTLEKSKSTISIEYKGRLFRASDEASPISPTGVALMSSDGWYPYLEGETVIFSLKTTTPENWSVVSHDQLLSEKKVAGFNYSHWISSSPQEDIYLMSNQWHRFEKQIGTYTARVYLFKNEPQLADKFIQTTEQFISLYQELLGPYAYKQMSTVENYWETGYGMPSFTLLGSRVTHFPFIFYSSFPHEILHNWWGNGVYIDWNSGNWAEGLTSYMADHYLQAQRGKDGSYRRTALLNFSVFAKSGHDFPLNQFRSRHDKASAAVGYSKGLMFFHMLKNEIGEKNFINGLRHFYQHNIYRAASFSDIRKSLETVTRSSLSPFFDQWILRTGAPKILLSNPTQVRTKKGYEVNFSIQQNQKGKPYSLKIPININVEGGGVINTTVRTNSASQKVSVTAKKPILSIVVDPGFDVFRYLFDEEIPSSVSKAMGSEQVTVLILPSQGPLSKTSYLKWAQDLSAQFSGKTEIQWDEKLTQLPSKKHVWILGRNNLFLPQVRKAADLQNVSVSKNSVSIHNKIYQLNTKTLFLTLKNGNTNLTWLSAPDEHTLSRSAAKIPHYGKYSYLAFEQEKNILKGEWIILNSPLRHHF